MDRHSDTRSQMNLGKRDSGVETAWLIAEIPDFSKEFIIVGNECSPCLALLALLIFDYVATLSM